MRIKTYNDNIYIHLNDKTHKHGTKRTYTIHGKTNNRKGYPRGYRGIGLVIQAFSSFYGSFRPNFESADLSRGKL